ncbi:hypothetical protein, partial [Saonia flava]
MNKKVLLLFSLFLSGFAFGQTTVTLQDQCNCEVLSGTDVSASGAITPSGADTGDIYVNTTTGTIYFWDGDSWELTSSDNQQVQVFNFNSTTNELTLTLENGGTLVADLSSLSDVLADTNTTNDRIEVIGTDLVVTDSDTNTVSVPLADIVAGVDTNTVITSYAIDGTNTNLVITDSEGTTFSIALADIAALIDTDDQTLSEVLTEGASAGNSSITNLADPTNAQDAATKAYVDAELAALNTDDADADPTNELSDVSLTGTTIE